MRFRDFIDPGGGVLSHRLDRLKDTLNRLGERLQETIADALGETLTGIVRDTAMHVLDNFAGYLPVTTPPDRTIEDRFAPEEHNIWLDEDEQDAYFQEPEPPRHPSEGSSERVTAAVSAGMQVASWWLRRWTGKSRSLTTAAVGVVAAGVAYMGGPVASAMFNLAGVATGFTSMSDALGTVILR